MARLGLSFIPDVHLGYRWILPVSSLRVGRGQHVPGSSNHSLYLIKLLGSGYPEGNFGGDRLLGGSISLSPHITMYDERFARQYRCGPTLEFPLSLPVTGIVRRLSRPSIYALAQTSPN